MQTLESTPVTQTVVHAPATPVGIKNLALFHLIKGFIIHAARKEGVKSFASVNLLGIGHKKWHTFLYTLHRSREKEFSRGCNIRFDEEGGYFKNPDLQGILAVLEDIYTTNPKTFRISLKPEDNNVSSLPQELGILMMEIARGIDGFLEF